MDVLDSSRREADRSTHADDLLALESLAALHPDVTSFESWLRDALGQTTSRGAVGAPVDGPQDQGPGVGARHRLRRVQGPLPAPAE